MSKINMASIKENGEDALEIAKLITDPWSAVEALRDAVARQEATVNRIMDLLQEARVDEAQLRAKLGKEMAVGLGSVRFQRLKVQYRDYLNEGK